MISTRDLKGYYTPDRRSGNSTRQTDFAIQQLFKGEIVHVEDHFGSVQSNKNLLRMILTRLEVESKIQAKNVKIEDKEDRITIQLLAKIPY